MILQLRRNVAAERISAVLFCLQLVVGIMRPSSAPSGPGVAVCAGAVGATPVASMHLSNESAHIPGRVRRPLRVPGFKTAVYGMCIAGAAGRARWTGDHGDREMGPALQVSHRLTES
jgi:hypothetical protein